MRRLLDLSDEMLGLLDDLLTKTLSPDWFSEFKKFLRKEPCWTAVAEKAEQVKTYLGKIHWFVVGAVKGKDTHATASKVFRAYFDPDFENWGVVFSGVAPAADFWVKKLILGGKFTDFLGNTAEVLEKRRMLGSQFLAICRDNKHQLRGEACANFFVLTKNDEPVAEDLHNVFVAFVLVLDEGSLHAGLDELSNEFAWDGRHGLRVFSPR